MWGAAEAKKSSRGRGGSEEKVGAQDRLHSFIHPFMRLAVPSLKYEFQLESLWGHPECVKYFVAVFSAEGNSLHFK